MKKRRLVLALLAFALAVSASGLASDPSSANPPVTITAKAINAADFSRRVSSQVQVQFVYVKSDPRQTFSAEFRRLPLEELARVLSSQGAVAFSRELRGPIDSHENLLGARVSLATADADGTMVADLLAQVSGERIRFKPRHAEERLAFDIKRVPIGELPRILAPFGDVTFPSSR